jgi:hypothetical protein
MTNEDAESYTYPLEKQDRNKSRISFQPLYVIPASEGAIDIITKSVNASRVELTDSEEAAIYYDDEGRQTDVPIPKDAPVVEGVAKLKFRPLPKHCYIYTPIGISFDDGVAIDVASFGSIGVAALAGMSAGGDILKSIMSGAGEVGKSIIDLVKSGASSDVGRVAASRVGQKLTGEGLTGAINTGLQVTSDPSNRSVFKGVDTRSFTFTFEFMPASSREADEIQKIIKFFRTQLYPEQILYGITGIPFGYKFPNLFRVRVQYEKSPGAFTSIDNMEILPCYLKNVSTNYNPQQSTFHKNGKPTQTNMTLSFTEYRTMHKKDIIDEYNGVNVNEDTIEQ